MYEYLKKRHIDSLSMGTDRYVQANTNSAVAPWARAETTVQNVDVRCYHNAPRELVLQQMVPYTMEISAPGNNFICIGNPRQECPESVHQNADPKDPWRINQCAAWKSGWERDAADIIASQEFRNQVTENVLNLAGISGWRRWFAKPAEFVQVLEEKESRERGIKIFALVAVAAGGGVILWRHLQSKKNKVSQNPESDNDYFSAKTGAKKVVFKKRKHGPGRMPDYAPDIARQIYRKMVDSAKRLGRGKMLREATPTWVHSYTSRKGYGWYIGTDIGDGNINYSLGFFWVDKYEEVNYREVEQIHEEGPLSGRGWQVRYPVSYDKAIFMASNYYQDRAKAGLI